MEQVLGRGIRTCSHSLLDAEQRNCTTYLLINTFVEGEDTETADMYMYRTAMTKAVLVGRVTRVLKRYALDCNLNRDAIIVSGLPTQRHVDSQGAVREEVNVNDTPYTNLCDWIEMCEYTCAQPVTIDSTKLDESTYDEYAVRWRESELKSAIRKLFEGERQPEFQLADILDAMSNVPHKAISGLLSEIVGNRSFRLHVNKADGYIVYRNGYFMFQPDYLADIRIPLALRVADVPVKRDSFDPASIKLAPALAPLKAEGIPSEAPRAEAEAPKAEAPEAEVPKAEAPEPTEAPEAVPSVITALWSALVDWGKTIHDGTASKDNVPAPLLQQISAQYGDKSREKSWLIMVNWMYDSIQSGEYVESQRASYRSALSQTLIEFIWDETLRPKEQLQLIQADDPFAIKAAKEQIVKKGSSEAFRYIDTTTGVLKYVCGSLPCSEAVTRVFESDPEDSIRNVKVNTTTTGPLYGFIVPKSKERRLVFKTASPPAPGGAPEKGGECAIISTISFHVKMLKDISNMLEAEGYPRFILVDEVLDEKARKRVERAEAKAAGRKSTVVSGREERTFENAVKACALKNIVLRWMTIMQDAKGGKRYFFRPIAAMKSGHKGTVVK